MSRKDAKLSFLFGWFHCSCALIVHRLTRCTKSESLENQHLFVFFSFPVHGWMTKEVILFLYSKQMYIYFLKQKVGSFLVKPSTAIFIFHNLYYPLPSQESFSLLHQECFSRELPLTVLLINNSSLTKRINRIMES